MPYSVSSTWRKSKVKWTVWGYLSREIQFNEKAIHFGELWTEYWCGPILKRQKSYKADLGWLFRAGAWFQASSETAHLLFSDVLGGCPHNLFLQHFKNWTVWTQNMSRFTFLAFLIIWNQSSCTYCWVRMVVWSPSGSVPTAGVQHLLDHDEK